MLKYEGQWEELSDHERLVVLAIALELRDVVGFQAMESSVCKVTGLSEEDFQSALEQLKVKELVQVDPPSCTSVNWLSFTGDAIWSGTLSFDKLQNHRRMLEIS